MKLASFCFSTVVAAALAEKPDGTCGNECTMDMECGGCGSEGTGQCSCPDGQDVDYPFETACSCVSTPSDPPKDPSSDVSDGQWPDQWTAKVTSWTYGTFEHNTTSASGTFFYDATRQATRAEWTPYITGSDATQIWITDLALGVSNYYVVNPQVCIYFPITDPGQTGKPVVGIEKPTWMEDCKKAGMATFVGREQVSGEWADHWSCHISYPEAVNPDNTTGQFITFQNWHSLGLGSTVKGLPMRVTGGNSKPDPQQGSPRLNTVWYYDFATGTDSTKDEDFAKPTQFCIPVGTDEAKQFFGHEVTNEHAWSGDFHQRAHYFAHSKPTVSDLRRAKQPKPVSSSVVGESFEETMKKLNAVLQKDEDLKTQECNEFSLPQLQQMQRRLFNARSTDLDAVYSKEQDTRIMAHDSLASLEREQRQHAELARSPVSDKVRDGVCHEMVMWYIHHLTEPARAELKNTLVLPLLPNKQHQTPATPDAVHTRYQSQVSCGICHVAPSSVAV